MKKKLVFLLLACLMLCVAVPAAMAEDEPNLATDFVYTETGDGNIAIRGYNKDTDPTVVIPSVIDEKPVTVIANNAFSPSNTQSTVTSVVIPNSVTAFGQSVFQSCTSLESVTLPNSITSIPNSTFKDCTSLKSITIPNSVKVIGNSAFSGCTSLESVTIPDSVTALEPNIFQGCTSLESVILPNSITSIPNSTFKDCTNLVSITIPDSVTAIGQNAFQGCTSLASITIPDSVTAIGRSVFQDCTSLESVLISESVTLMESYAFLRCTNLETIEFLGKTAPTFETAWCNAEAVGVIYVPHDTVAAYQAALGNGSADKVRCKTHNAVICFPVVTVSVSPADGGSATGGGAYNHGDTVTLTAVPEVGYAFAGWQINSQTVSENPYSFTVTENVTATALFTLNDYVVTVTTSQGGEVQGGGLYQHGDTVTLIATPDTGYSFVGWYVNNQLVSMDATYSFTVTESVSVNALFEKMPVLPQTGDDSNVILWSALACISLFGMMMLVCKRKEA